MGTRRYGDEMSGPVGIRNRTKNVANLFDDKEFVVGLLAQIDESNGGKLKAWNPVRPAVGIDGTCPKEIADAIWDFQVLWKSQGKFKVIDGVVDPHGHTKQMMEWIILGLANAPDPALRFDPEGQFDTTACWAACYTWWLRAFPGETAMRQLDVIAAGAGASIVLLDGTVDTNGYMGFLAHRHTSKRAERMAVGAVGTFLSAWPIRLKPVIIGFTRGPAGGHANVIHGYDATSNEVSVMECWFKPPEVDPNYEMLIMPPQVTGPYVNKRTGDPFKFTGTHTKRSLNYYTANAPAGTVMLFPTGE